MSKRKKLTDFPAFVHADELFQKIESESAQVRDRLIEIENKLTAVRENREQSALAAFQAEESPWTTQRAELLEEYRRLEQRQQFLNKARDEAREKRQGALGRASLSICNEEVRPSFVEPITRLLAALKTACDANDELRRLRAEIEAEVITTGSIPFCLMPELGSWGDRLNMGIALRYREWIGTNFPEVKI